MNWRGARKSTNVFDTRPIWGRDNLPNLGRTGLISQEYLDALNERERFAEEAKRRDFLSSVEPDNAFVRSRFGVEPGINPTEENSMVRKLAVQKLMMRNYGLGHEESKGLIDKYGLGGALAYLDFTRGR